MLTLTRKLDPDSIFSNDTLNCDFYNDGSLNSMLRDKIVYLLCIHFEYSLRSLCRNLNQLQHTQIGYRYFRNVASGFSCSPC
jgi:hypothetical protein